MPFDAVPAELYPPGQDRIFGDAQILAGTRVIRLTGLSSGALSEMPGGTFFANLFTTVEPGRAFDANIIAGDGLSYDVDIKNGPFGEIVGELNLTFTLTTTAASVTLPPTTIKDRVIIVTQHNGVNTITTPTGYTLLGHVSLADSDANVYERIIDGTEDPEVIFASSLSSAVLVKVWVVRYSNTTLPSELVSSSNTSAVGTTNDPGDLTPTWGLANTLWLSAICIEAHDPTPPNVTVFPTGFPDTGEFQNVSATASLDGAIGYCSLQFRDTHLDAAGYTYAASRSAAFVIAVPPREAGALNVIAGGGSAGWDDVLLIDAHSGASNPIVDDAQFMQFGVAAPPATGQIRSNNNFLINGDKFVHILAGEDFDVRGFDSSTIRVTAGALSVRAFDGMTIQSDDSFVNLDAFTSMTLTSVADMTLTTSGSLFLGDLTLTNDLDIKSSAVINMETGGPLNVTATNLNATIAGSVNLDAGTSVVLNSPLVSVAQGFLRFTATAASTPSMSAGQGLFRVQTGTPTDPSFTDSGDTDREIATYPLKIAGFPSISAKSVLANATNATAAATAVASSAALQYFRVNSANTALEWATLSNHASTSITYTSDQFQRAALTGDVTASANSNATSIANDAVTNAKLANMASPSLKGRTTASTGDPEDLTLVNSTSITWNTGTGGSISVQLAAMTGAVTSSANSTATTFGALAAKSVLANATNASAVPAALGGTVALQHLRVNAANTGLEWSVITSADIPAGTVPLTGLATQAANTFVANATAGVASPTAVASNAEGVMGRTSGNIQSIDSAVQSALIRGAGSVFWGAAAADQVLRRSGSGDLGFGTLVTNNIGANQVTNARLAQMATARLKGRTTALTGDPEDLTLTNSTSITWNVATGGTVSLERAAFTGDVTAPANSNALTIAVNVVGNTELRDSAALSLIGRSANSIGDPADIVAGADDRVMRRTGSTLNFGQLTAGMFAAATVPLTAIATIANQTVLGNGSGGTASPVALTLNAPFIATAGTLQLQLLIGGGIEVQSNALRFSKKRNFDTWWDDFTYVGNEGTVGTSSANIATGEGNWSALAAVGTGTVSVVAAESGHPGILRLSTTAVNGDRVQLTKSTLGSTGNIRGDQLHSALAILRLPSTTSVFYSFGVGDTGPITSATNCLLFVFDNTDTTVHAICREAAVTTDVDTGVTPGTGWNTYEILQDVSGTIEFYMDDILTNTVNTNIPDAETMCIGMGLLTRGAAVRTMDIDYVSYESVSLGARTT